MHTAVHFSLVSDREKVALHCPPLQSYIMPLGTCSVGTTLLSMPAHCVQYVVVRIQLDTGYCTGQPVVCLVSPETRLLIEQQSLFNLSINGCLSDLDQVR